VFGVANIFLLLCIVDIFCLVVICADTWVLFLGKVITAAYVPLPNYHALFPDASRAVQLVMSSSQAATARALGTSGVLAPGLQYMQA